MNQGKFVFSQFMVFLPWSTFRRCVGIHRGDHKVQDFTCMDQFLTMAFAQLTYCESLRDIEVNLRAKAKRHGHEGDDEGQQRQNVFYAHDGQSRRDFDFAMIMRIDHQRALDMAQTELKNGKNLKCAR